MYKGCRYFLVLAAFIVGLGVLGGANEVGAVSVIDKVSIISPDSGVVRGIDSLIVAKVEVFDVPANDSLAVIMYLVIEDPTEDETADSANVVGEQNNAAVFSVPIGAPIDQKFELQHLTETNARTLGVGVNAQADRVDALNSFISAANPTLEYHGITGTDGIVAVQKRKDESSKVFTGDADSVTTKDRTNGTEFTWYVKVSSQVGELKTVRVAAFVIEDGDLTDTDGAINDKGSGIIVSSAKQQFSVDGDRPTDPHIDAFANTRNAPLSTARDDGIVGVTDGIDTLANSAFGPQPFIPVAGFDGGNQIILGIDDSLRLRVALGADAAKVVGPSASVELAAVIFDEVFYIDKNNRRAGDDTVNFDLKLAEDQFGSGTEKCCAGTAAGATDTLQIVYVDGAGNLSGIEDGDVVGAQAVTTFLVDTKRPSLETTKDDTFIFVSDPDTITDGTLNSGFSSDINTLNWKLGESLDSLSVTFDGAQVEVQFGLLATGGLDDKALRAGVDRVLDFTALGDLNEEDPLTTAKDSVYVMSINEDGDFVRETHLDEADVIYEQTDVVKANTDSILTGVHAIKFRGMDFGGNLGPEYAIENVYVDVDDIDFIRLFPTTPGFGEEKEGETRTDTIEEETAKISFQLSEPADSVLIAYNGISGPDEDVERTRRLSGSELTNTASGQLIQIDSLKHGTKYELTVLGRDLAGNYTREGPFEFLYDTTHVVPTITRFILKGTVTREDKAVDVGLDNTREKHAMAGEKVTLTITADATTDGSRAAVTYRQEAILKVAVTGSDVATTGVALEGNGVTDMGGGRAMLSALDWSTGSRTVTLTDTAAIETLSVSIVDSASADGPFAGALDSSIVVNTGDFKQIVVSAPDTVTQGEDFWVTLGLGDGYGNPRLADNRYVSASANKLGVQVPSGAHLVAGGMGGFTVNSGTFAGGGLVISVRDIVATALDPEKEDKGNNFKDGQSAAIYVKTPGEVIVGTTVDRPDTLIVEDYMGADGAGDQGGFLVLTWDLSDNHTPGGAYRIYREVHVNYAPAGDDDTTGAAVVELDSPAAVPVPWAKIDMVPKEDIARAIVATLDNVASMWFVAAEVGGATSAKHAFADVASFMSPAGLMDEPMVSGIASRVSVTRVSSPYELMAEAMVASKQAGLVDPDAPVFATLTPEALAYAERGVGLRLKDTGGDVQSSDLTPSAEAVAAIDNIPPEPITNLRVMDTPGDAGASIDVVWTKSASDRLVPRSASGAIGLEAVSDIVPGVVGYNVYRKLSGGEFTPVGMTDAGVTTLSDVTALNGVRYTYQVSSFDLDNETVSDLERTAMAIRNNVVDKSGSPIYGLFGPDQSVGFDDFFIFADFFGLDAGSDDFDPAFDLSRNNKIDFDDFFVFADNFGRSVEVSGKAVPALAGLNPEASLFLEAAAELPRVGEEMVVDVGLADFAELKAYGFTVNYDADRLEFVKVLGGAGILGETELAQPHIVAQGDGAISLAAYGQIVDKGELDLSLVFRPTMEIEDSRIYFSEGQLRDGNYGVNQVARLGEVQIQTRPEVFALADNYPNPFNPETTIKYALPEAVDVRLDIYNMLGQMVRTMVAENQSPGRYVVRWDATDDSGSDLSTGIYFYRLRAGDFLETKKMLLLK